MKINPDILQKAERLTRAAYLRIGTDNMEQNVTRTLRFARNQPPEGINLDGQRIVAVAVDIASVFSPENYYHTRVDKNGIPCTAEIYQALSIVLTDQDVKLCKSTFDVVSGSEFINGEYRSTSLDDLTERYIF